MAKDRRHQKRSGDQRRLSPAGPQSAATGGGRRTPPASKQLTGLEGRGQGLRAKPVEEVLSSEGLRPPITPHTDAIDTTWLDLATRTHRAPGRGQSPTEEADGRARTVPGRSPLPSSVDSVLTPEQERECEDRGYKSRLAVTVTGDCDAEGRNVVRVGKQTVLLGPMLFRRFFQLVVSLKRDPGGLVSDDELVGADHYGGVHQAIARLRNSFRYALGDLRPLDFIERRGRGFLLSTHPALIEVERKRLLKHTDDGIQELAKQLPNT